MAVEVVGSLRLTGMAVDRNADEKARDGRIAGVVELPAHARVIGAVAVAQLCLLVADDQVPGRDRCCVREWRLAHGRA
jgi:hypothetical protein